MRAATTCYGAGCGVRTAGADDALDSSLATRIHDAAATAANTPEVPHRIGLGSMQMKSSAPSQVDSRRSVSPIRLCQPAT